MLQLLELTQRPIKCTEKVPFKNVLLTNVKHHFRGEVPRKCISLKSKLLSSISDFCPTALLNVEVEEKLFFSLVSRQLETYLMKKTIL